jgi:multicomponent K+:H+ antiporter subunit C
MIEDVPLMEGIYSFCVGLLTAAGIYLCLRGRTFSVVVGLTLLSYAVNLFLFASGRLRVNAAVILGESADYADPLPQALVLTAIVIGFAMTAFIVILAIRARADMGNDHVDGRSHPEDQSGGMQDYGHGKPMGHKSNTVVKSSRPGRVSSIAGSASADNGSTSTANISQDAID